MLRPAAAFVLGICLAAAQIEYRAVTDRVPRPKPPLDRIGKAGSIVRDPVYGTRILRVTDGRTNPEGAPCVTAAAAFQNTWNADSTRFVAMCGGAVAFRFDAASLKARISDDMVDLRETPAFSFNDPDLLYGIGASPGTSRSIVEYDAKRRKYRTLLDLERVVKDFEGIPGLLTVSANDRMAVAFGGIQDTWRYVLVFNKRTGGKTLLDTRAAAIDGEPAGFPMGFGVHVVNIDKSGRYVVISKGQNSKPPNLLVWDTQENEFAEVTPEGAGHYATGWGKLVNNSGTFPHWAQWMLRPLAPEGIGNFTRLIVPDPPRDFGGRYEHSSWNNARPGVDAPVFVSIMRYRDARNPLGPWDDEIVAISTAPDKPNVFRFAFHRSAPLGEFWDDPRGNVSPDGRFFMFTSNWEGTLGNTRRGRPRQDVFVLELPLMVRAGAGGQEL